MIERYTLPEMKDIWSEEKKLDSWLLVEIYSLEIYSKHNKNIKQEDISKIKDNIKIDIQKMKDYEKIYKHDVVSFTRMLSDSLGVEKKWIHYGLTSTDVVDTAQGYILKEVNNLIKEKLINLQKTIKSIAKEHKYTYQIGRTHGIHAEITTFGYKMLLWYEEISRNIERFDSACKGVEVGKISGAVGNFINIPLDVQEYVCKKMGIGYATTSSQTLQRDRHAQYISTIGIIASTLEKMSVEIRHLQRTEVNEVFEHFSKDQKGSSAMPHKKNPISSENISGLSRILRGFVITALENIPLWHERDISHSSSERIMLSGATTLIHYMLNRMNNILGNLYVNKNQMLKNINMTKGVVFSQKALLYIIENKNLTREEAYDIIQPIAIKSYKNNLNFKEELLFHKILNLEEAEEVFNYEKKLNNSLNLVFKKLNI